MNFVTDGIGELIVKEDDWEKTQRILRRKKAVMIVDPPKDGFIHIFYDLRPVHENELGIYLYGKSLEKSKEGLVLY